MSNDFKKVLVKDDRLMVSDSVSYAVQKGGQNVVCAPIPALALSNSSLTFNIQVPSEQTVVDRRLVWAQTISVSFQASVSDLAYGTDVVLAPFPSHQLCSTIQATVNNNTTSINIRDVLPALLKMEEGVELQRYSGTTPTLPDSYYLATAGVGDVNNVNGGYNIYSGANMARGAFFGYPVDKGVPSGVSMARATAATSAPYTYTVTWSTAEPFICPPFLWGTQLSNTSGIYGVQNMTLLCNFSNGNRAIRFITAKAQSAYSGSGSLPVTINNPEKAKMLLNYLTPHPSDLMPARNVVPYMEYPRYFSSTQSTINAGAVGTITSNTYNLNQIPDKLIIFARVKQSDQTPSINDVFMAIQGISINFNNNAGILSSASTADLYRYSVEAGNNQSWIEWCGNSYDATGLAQATTQTPTVGSVLALDFGRHIQLIEDYYAPGSLGNFQIQFQLDVVNQSASNLIPELVLITVNSGVFVTERGQSSVYTGILTKQDVLDASQQEPFSIAHVTRKVGAGLLDRGKALPKHFGGKHKMDYVESMKGGLSKRLM
jgi:hypothetical protein